MNAIDTNVLVYAHDPANPAKQKCARELIENITDPVLLWQVATEYLAVIHKLKNKGMAIDTHDAFAKVRDLAGLWPLILPSAGLIDRCENLMSKYSLQYWDAMIVAACLDAGVETLYSEDINPGEMPGLRFINPFVVAAP